MAEIQVIAPEAKAKFRRLREARVKRDEDKAAAKASEEAYRELEAEVYEELEEAMGNKTLPVDLGDPWGLVKFRTRETYYAKIIDPEKAGEYYEQRAMMDEVSAPKFVMARLNDEVRERMDLGQGMPPGIDFYPNRGVTITRQKD
jgi:hypothetical protein